MKPAVPLTIALLLAAGCARDEDASVRPAEANAVERVGDHDQEEERPALGEWRRTLLAEQPALEFGPAGTQPLITLACGPERGVMLQRPGPLAPGTQATVAVSVGGQARQLPLAMVGGTSPASRTSITSGDPLLGQIGGAQAPIRLRFGDGTNIILPPNELIGQFIQACSSGQHPPASVLPAAANVQAGAETAETEASNAAR